MKDERRLYLENDYILQEIEVIKKELYNVKRNVPRINIVSKQVNVIINSNVELDIMEVDKGSMVVINITSTGTTNAVGSATITAKIDNNVVVEQNVYYRDTTITNTLVFDADVVGTCKIVIAAVDELVPLKVDNIQAYIIGNK